MANGYLPHILRNPPVGQTHTWSFECIPHCYESSHELARRRTTDRWWFRSMWTALLLPLGRKRRVKFQQNLHHCIKNLNVYALHLSYHCDICHQENDTSEYFKKYCQQILKSPQRNTITGLVFQFNGDKIKHTWSCIPFMNPHYIIRNLWYFHFIRNELWLRQPKHFSCKAACLKCVPSFIWVERERSSQNRKSHYLCFLSPTTFDYSSENGHIPVVIAL